MDEDYREVEYDKYCEICLHKGKAENEYPCDECLAEPIRLYTNKPFWYEEKTK